jgi:hypothetical protein
MSHFPLFAKLESPRQLSLYRELQEILGVLLDFQTHITCAREAAYSSGNRDNLA